MYNQPRLDATHLLLQFGFLATAVAVIGAAVALSSNDHEARRLGVVAFGVGALIGGICFGGDYLYRGQQAAIGVPVKGGRGLAVIASLLGVAGSAVLSAWLREAGPPVLTTKSWSELELPALAFTLLAASLAIAGAATRQK
jgi:hypothetical protein